MNSEVMILREVVVKVTQLLAGMGLKVTQRGTQAAVFTNKRTHKVESVNIPFIPDNASKELIFAIQGFIDHEVAHILETDFSVHSKFGKNATLRSIWNALEDTFIERQMAKRFAGSGYNLERLHEFFVAEITTPALEEAIKREDWLRAFSVLMVPYVRAWSGQRVFRDFVAAGQHDTRPELRAMFNRVNEFAPEVPKLKSTADCYALAVKIDEALKAPPPPPPPPPPPMPAPPQEDEQEPEPQDPNEEPENEPQGANGGEGETPEDEGKGASEEPQDDEADDQDASGKPSKDGDEDDSDDEQKGDDDADADGNDAADGDEAAEEDEAGEGSAGGESDGADADEEAGDEPNEDDSGDQGDGAAGDDDAEEDAGSDVGGDAGGDEEGSDDGDDDDAGDVGGEGASGEDGDAGDDEDGKRDDAQPGDEGDPDEGKDQDGEADADGGSSAGKGGETDDDGEEELNEGEPDEDADARGNEEPDTDVGAPVILVSNDVDYDGQLAARIGAEAKDATIASDYRVYSKDFDVIEPFKVDEKEYEDRWLTDLDDRTRQSVGVMQRDIERMMAARSQVINVPGFRSGRLHTSGLHRLAAGDDRVFRRRHENPSLDVVVGLLIDNSGSMEGEKMRAAMEAGYALSSTLERVGIKHEAMGFTTTWNPGGGGFKEAYDHGRAHGIVYSRYEPLYMPIYKGFDERLTSEVKRRFAAAPNTSHDFMGSNVDGESVEVAGWRLLRRQEKRKVLLVLSDGNPVCHGDIPAMRAHLSATVLDMEKRGVETIGVGIMTDAPKHYYQKFALLNSAAELPKTVMGELKRILLG